MEDSLEFQRDLLASFIFVHGELGNADELALYETLLSEVELGLEAGKAQVWIINQETGDLTYQPLGTVFPETIGRFVRKEHHMFNNEGTDVSVGYQITDLSDKAYMTIYLSNYPQTDFDGFIAFSKRDLLARYQGTADIIDEKRIIFPALRMRRKAARMGSALRLKIPKIMTTGPMRNFGSRATATGL